MCCKRIWHNNKGLTTLISTEREDKRTGRVRLRYALIFLFFFFGKRFRRTRKYLHNLRRLYSTVYYRGVRMLTTKGLKRTTYLHIAWRAHFGFKARTRLHAEGARADCVYERVLLAADFLMPPYPLILLF